MSKQNEDVTSERPWVVVFDAGKSFTKLILFSPCGKVQDQRRRATNGDGRSLDCDGIEAWLIGTLAELAARYPIDVIVPIGHGAAAAVVDRGRLLGSVPDYEASVDPLVAKSYTAQRDVFDLNGSPMLPGGLNLGMQLHALEYRRGKTLPPSAMIVPWPQYWTWRLTGVMRSEVTSLGCHSDLWNPAEATFSPLCQRRGWSRLLAPLARAADVAGPLRGDLAALLDLPKVPIVLVGLHDSNAALLAARRLASDDITVISTGTWFVAMGPSGPRYLPANRDCLMNVDVEGRPVPSARWMGGREIIGLLGNQALVGDACTPVAIQEILSLEPMIKPDPSTGGQSQWCHQPHSLELREGAVLIHAGLMVDAMLDVVGVGEAIIVEGRFAASRLPWEVLAALRPHVPVFALPPTADAAFGAFSLAQPDALGPPLSPRIEPLSLPLAEFKARWRALAASPW